MTAVKLTPVVTTNWWQRFGQHPFSLQISGSGAEKTIVITISLTDPCKFYFQGDILFALVVVSYDFPNVWKFF